jgi:hypothetical protein
MLVRGGALALAALALVALVVPFAKGPDDRTVPSSVFTDYFAARGQSYCWGDCPAGTARTCISGDCPCFDEPYRTQCFAERKSSFESQNPPRGEITGVCWASLGKWERDQSGKEVFRTRSPIYSKVRFNETQTLSKWARDDRDAGFEVEVGQAWSEFVQQTYSAEFPATDGWNWSTSCVSLSSPRRTEDQNWAKAQEQASYQRVFMPTFGVADTLEERAAEAKAKAEREARAAEQKRIADAKAAEEARQRAAAEAARRQRVNAIAQEIGPGKTAAAERLVQLNEEAAKFRPQPRPTASATPAATPTPASTPRQCTQRQGTQPASYTADTREKAEAGVLRSRGVPGGSESIVSSSVSGASCTQRNQFYMKPPPVGTCLACVDEKLAINLYGYVPGKGYPPPKTEWVCKATVTFVAERCGSGTSKVSAQ